ncbi:DUF3042 family protein [Lactococcus cremoris]|uniref:DUF3042 family protein n=1 Tax=Lactococcus lactis subsp. cremoris TaxID=1359 RepID=UPI002FC8D159
MKTKGAPQLKNKFIQGYLIGKSVEILVAGTALLIAKKKGYLPSADKAEFIARKRLAR